MAVGECYRCLGVRHLLRRPPHGSSWAASLFVVAVASWSAFEGSGRRNISLYSLSLSSRPNCIPTPSIPRSGRRPLTGPSNPDVSETENAETDQLTKAWSGDHSLSLSASTDSVRRGKQHLKRKPLLQTPLQQSHTRQAGR